MASGARGLPLVEREAELATFDAALAAARSGTSTIVLVEGPSGIGKTGLLRAARASTAPGAA